MDARRFRELLAQAVLLAAVLFCFTLRVARVSGLSMEPTVPVDSLVLVSTLDFRLRPPSAGEVIAFAHDRLGPEIFVKRVIATPGDRVVEVRGVMLVNGRVFDSGAARIFDRRSTAATLLPPQRYYVVGDNRPASDDSRNWGPIRRSAFIGRVDAVLWPLAGIRLVR